MAVHGVDRGGGAGGVSDGDKGDVTVSGSGATFTVDNDTVTNAKLANMATATFKGRTTAGTGDPEDLTVTQANNLLGYYFVVKTTNTTAITSSSLATVTIGAAGGGNMELAVVSGRRYRFKASYLVQSDTTTSGISMSVTIPSVTEFAAVGRGISASDATSGEYQGAITASDDAVTVANVQAINTNYVQFVEGLIVPSASGNITMRVANEAGAGNVSVREGSVLELWDFGA